MPKTESSRPVTAQPGTAPEAATVIVSGLPRSGTSLMMQMLERAGIAPLTDGLRAADEDNPRGYYELERVKQIAEDVSFLERARGGSVKLISQLLMEVPAAGHYRVIFMRRRLDEVLTSQRRMLKRRGEDAELEREDSAVKDVFVGHLEDVEAWLRTRADIDVLYVNYNRLLADPDRQIARVVKFLDAAGFSELDSAAMKTAIDPALYRNRAG